MPPGQRKKPFSGKKKKEQLQEKRQRKQTQAEEDLKQTLVLTEEEVKRFNNEMRGAGPTFQVPQASGSGGGGRNTGRGRFQLSNAEKLRTVFEKEPVEFVEQRRRESRLPIVRGDEIRADAFYSQIIDIPKRPSWTYEMTKEQVEGQEARMFEAYLSGIYSRFPIRRLNYFEHNLEVWRQLWRVCEVSDVCLILADIRHPTFHFPPALYNYVVRHLQKPLILVLTKCDLVPTDNVVKWTQFFTDNFPGLYVVSYTSYERRNASEDSTMTIGNKKKRTKRGKNYYPTGVELIMNIVRDLKIVKKGRLVPVDYSPPNAQPSIVSLEKIQEATSPASSSASVPSPVDEDIENLKKKYGSSATNSNEDEDDVIENEVDEEEEELEENEKEEERKRIEEAINEDHYVKREFDYVVLGLIGNPNVGKSTFINAMKGRKVCSTSRTPGHTKWKQTIFLNKDLMLVDCPGLVFPAVDMPKQLQILCGIFPIAQVREPFSAIQYMAKFVPIEKIYKLNIADARNKPDKFNPAKGEIEWSAWMICEAYAEKRGYHTRSGLDVHRAGLEILFDIIDGRLILYFLPNQTTINMGDFSEERLCKPLTELSPEEKDKLADIATNINEWSAETSSAPQGRTKKRGEKLVAVANVPKGPSAADTTTDEESEEGEEDGETDDEGDDNEGGSDVQGETATSSNPWDVLS